MISNDGFQQDPADRWRRRYGVGRNNYCFVRLTDDEKLNMLALAHIRGQNISELLRHLIEFALEDIDPSTLIEHKLVVQWRIPLFRQGALDMPQLPRSD